MGWNFNGTRIYVNKLETSNPQIIAKLQPLDTDTVYHVFGWEKEKMNLAGLIVTNTDKEALEALYKTGLSYTLSGPEGSIGDYLVKEVKFNRLETVYICLYGRPGLDPYTPQYDVALELYLDD